MDLVEKKAVFYLDDLGKVLDEEPVPDDMVDMVEDIMANCEAIMSTII